MHVPIDHARRRTWLKAIASLVPSPLAVLSGELLHCQESQAAEAFPQSSALTALMSASSWFNAPATGAPVMLGQVVLVVFWTYSCINSLRVLPYLQAWSSRYESAGLVIVGVHTPEFAFEADSSNVQRAVADLGIEFPVALDGNHRIWREFGNAAWPTFYFIDAAGRVRGRAVGEGEYERSEQMLWELLSQRSGAQIPFGFSQVSGAGVQAPPDLLNLHSRETYVGHRQASGFASPGGLTRDLPAAYLLPGKLALDRWALAGPWTVGPEFASSNAPRARVAFRFHARDLHLVLGPSREGTSVRFRIRLDGEAPGEDHGVDVDRDGFGIARMPRMVQMVRQHGAIVERTFEVEFLETVRVYVFTFG